MVIYVTLNIWQNFGIVFIQLLLEWYLIIFVYEL